MPTGCAYYNGMYNANRFAKQAERSERAGRQAEARDRWQRAALHAESVATRHPNSRWADDARLVQGRAQLRLENWPAAAAALRLAAAAAQEPEQRLEALLLYGQAATAMRRYDEAGPALDSALASGLASRRSAAFLARGRLRLARRDAAGALADFAASDAFIAPLWRARASLALGDAEAAATALDEQSASPRLYNERDWLPLLDSIAAAGAPDRAAAIVERLVADRTLGRGAHARLLLADGARLALRDRDSLAGARFAAVAALVPDSIEARTAALRMILLELKAADDDSQWAEARRRIAAIAQQGGAAGRESDGALRLLTRVAVPADTPTAGADARWFLRAELTRDSLGMPRRAALLFREMAVRYPASPWAPKALIAALATGFGDSAAATELLTTRYARSPYVIAMNGGDAPGYAALEDSLLALLAPSRTGTSPATPGRGDLTEEEEDMRRRARAGERPAPRPAPTTPQPRDPIP